MGVEISIEYQGDLHCSAQHGPSGNGLVTDAPTDNGGRGEAFSPTDLVATALGTCVATVMGIVAGRDGLDIAGTRIRVVKEMVQQPVRRIGALRVTVTYPADKPLSAEARAKLENAARLCPVKQSLHPDVNVELTFA